MEMLVIKRVGVASLRVHPASLRVHLVPRHVHPYLGVKQKMPVIIEMHVRGKPWKFVSSPLVLKTERICKTPLHVSPASLHVHLVIRKIHESLWKIHLTNEAWIPVSFQISGKIWIPIIILVTVTSNVLIAKMVFSVKFR